MMTEILLRRQLSGGFKAAAAQHRATLPGAMDQALFAAFAFAAASTRVRDGLFASMQRRPLTVRFRQAREAGCLTKKAELCATEHRVAGCR